MTTMSWRQTLGTWAAGALLWGLVLVVVAMLSWLVVASMEQ